MATEEGAPAGADGVGVRGRSPWRMVLRAFCIQNVAIGSSFGVFSVTVLPLQERFGASLALVTLGLSFVILQMGLLGPLAASLISRFGSRPTMSGGIVLSGCGYVVMAFAPNIWTILAAYVLLVGPGIAFCGSLATSTLVGQWVEKNRGRALGFTNAPLFVALGPVIGHEVIVHFGLTALYAGLAGLHVLLVPILAGIANPSGHIERHAPSSARRGQLGMILRQRLFWLVSIAGGMLAAISVVGLSHMVVIGVELGFSVANASILASVMGGASVVGAVAVGFVCDRLGGARTIGLIGLLYVLCWSTLLLVSVFWLSVPVILVLGACGAGVYPSVVVFLSRFFDSGRLVRALGLYSVLCLPFTFFLPPLASVLRDMAGRYAPVMVLLIALSGLVILIAAWLAGRERGGGRVLAG